MISIISQEYYAATRYLRDKLSANLIDIAVIVANGNDAVNAQSSMAMKTSDIILFVGKTAELKRQFAECFSVPMFYDKHAEKSIEKYYADTNQPLPPQYVLDKVCALPENFVHYSIIDATQNACYGEYNKVSVFILPDSLEIVDIIYKTYIEKAVYKIYPQCSVNNYKIFALSKSDILDRIEKFSNSKFVSYKCETDDYLDSNLTVTFKQSAGRQMINAFDNAIKKDFGDYLYADSNCKLQDLVVNLLTSIHKRVAVAESLTGGLITDKLVEVPGASKVLFEGVVTYTVESKCKRLGINPHLIDRCGVVSNEVAREMAKNLLKSGVDFSIATTGYAGPTAERGLPVGLCYIAIGSPHGIRVFKNIFQGNREQIRMQATNSALYLLLKAIKTK
ncbi:MAG: nicotinamide-nucleotide amidohydrolase family protein [Corallococcus sp.]|nr:nicotinamide-nucleotide amidohydrolase family protein [Corallococcus sp.]